MPDLPPIAATLVFGWLVWLKAWLGGVRLEVGRGRIAEAYVARLPLPDDWAPEADWERGYLSHRAQPERSVRLALFARLGGAKLFLRQWRRLFCTFMTFDRTLRGDGVLPCAQVRRPDGGPEPPAQQLGERDHAPRGVPWRGDGAWAKGR